ncbi:SDR family oxidoreductase [Amycolatopsis carbonis]|uniref:SDR family oxidoreductase n=1 Tax=Amycolatopsis carbonis TaxID=715471 RepID=A0A9Y2IJH8_9PSEU|nr:SDR family oxidoreductase [Amycolatopsis sp. 2-15]WIX80912.1 SDR family oxidoreductase [Amycolatopsis sp. 2-15]
MTTPVALVTGAGKGIGKAIAAGLAARGFDVWLGARDRSRGTAAAAEVGGRFVRLDVTSDEEVAAAVRTIGRLDVLVNNAGTNTGGYGLPSREDVASMRQVYETNVFGVVRVTNAFLPLLRESAAGRIVMVSSMRGSLAEPGAWAGRPSMPYSSSKTALNALTAHYAHELADTAIKVNSACPGHVATDFNAFRGTRTPEEGAAEAIRLATLGPDGPTGKSFQDGRELAW